MDKRTDLLVEVAKRHGLKPAKRWRGGRHKLRTLLITALAASGPLAGIATTTYELVYDKPTKTLLGARVAENVNIRGVEKSNPLYAYTTFIYLTATGSNSWAVPADWNNADNQIECIGGGASGSGGSTAFGGTAANGGGGGAYATAFNVSLTPGGTASYTINAGADTNFASVCIAKAGVGTTGGQAASCTPSSGAFKGGNGGVGGGANQWHGGGGGGGGAAGPSGAGSNGGNGGSAGTPGSIGGAGGGPAGAGSWSTPSAAGPGAGGSGGGAQSTPSQGNAGSAGGLYGGGGGGGGKRYNVNIGAAGAGRQGIIRISYTPAAGGVQFRAQIIF